LTFDVVFIDNLRVTDNMCCPRGCHWSSACSSK